MSELSKAKERMLSRKSRESEAEQRQSQEKLPRKFTVSSLTGRHEHHSEDPHQRSFVRSSTGWLRKIPDSPSHGRSIQSFASGAKENTPQRVKTIKVKVRDQSRFNTPFSQPSEIPLEESRYEPSPPRVDYKKRLHRQPIELVVAPPQPRRQLSPYKPKQCSIEYTQSFINDEISKGRAFVDEQFPPAPTMLFSRKLLYQEEGLKFERLSRIYSNDLAIVRCCEPTYISLGKYTNPFLFSALAMLAEDPARVLGLFGNQQANQKGVYHVHLCKDGTWRYIVVDDFVPVKSVSGRKQLLFMHSRQENNYVELWPALVQKALTKIYGTYLDLAMVREDGMCNLFRTLTSAPVSRYRLNKDFKSYLYLIDSALKRGHIVTLEQVAEVNVEAAEARNLHPFMAYRILQFKKSGVRLRNYAQPELVTKLPFEECLIFSQLIIYRVEPSYCYIGHKLRHKKDYYSKLKMTVGNPTRCFLDVWQNNPAYYKKHLGSHIDYEQARHKIWLSRQEEEQGEWVEPGRETQLTPGVYDIKVHLYQQKEYDFTLSYYGEKEVELVRVKNCQKWSQP